MTDNYLTTQTDKGDIRISEDAIAVIVSSAVAETEGVAGFANASGTDIADFLGVKSISKGLRISCQDGKAVIDIIITVRYGYGVTVVAKKVQEAVCSCVEDTVGIRPVVNVHITGISFEKSDMKG